MKQFAAGATTSNPYLINFVIYYQMLKGDVDRHDIAFIVVSTITHFLSNYVPSE